MDLLKPDNNDGTFCLNCGSPVYGRPDKKFCSQVCKDRYNYRIHSESQMFKRRIMMNIQMNYSILCKLLEKGCNCAERVDLEEMGFKPNCVTGFRKSQHNSALELRCFDVRYRISGTRIYNIAYIDTAKPSSKDNLTVAG